jgi:hypothetical protein
LKTFAGKNNIFIMAEGTAEIAAAEKDGSSDMFRVV